MEPRSFDALTRSLASSKSRRGLLAGIGALVLGARGASATVSPCPYPGQTLNKKGDCSCPAGLGDICPGIGCTNRKKDPSNCGSCGTVCSADATCVKGECTCPAGGCASTTCNPGGTVGCTIANFATFCCTQACLFVPAGNPVGSCLGA